MDTATELPGLETPAGINVIRGVFGAGATELETLAAIVEIEESAGTLTGAKRTIKQLCISLAISIDKGNNKGRAIANEAAQLLAMMQQLEPADDAGDTSDDNYSDAMRRLFDAFQTAPKLDTMAQGDPAQP